MRLFLQSLLISLLTTSLIGVFGVATNAPDISKRDVNHYVFTHFMIGIVSDRGSPADYDADFQKMKSVGIDAAALNIGVDPYTEAQLNLAYQSAANNDFKVFISFDFNWYHDTSDAARIGNLISTYGSLPAQFKYNNKVFVSSFAGDQLNLDAVRAAAGALDLFFALNWHPELGTNFSPLDSALNWMAWPNDGNNKAPKPGQNVTVQEGDQRYIQALAGKPYLAPVSPAFFTHFGPEVSYSKNWLFPTNDLWWQRWWQILALQPQFVEIVTWNDYGESHYVAPLSSKHTDDGASKWVNDMPHSGWLDMAKPFIAAYKAGEQSPNAHITGDTLVYWFRPTPKNLDCDSTDTTANTPANNGSGNYFMGRPDGWDSELDKVYVVALLSSAGIIEVNSGGTLYTYNAPAGASSFGVDFSVGSQSFTVKRNGQVVNSSTALREISNDCLKQCGIYNFNMFVGTVPPGVSDPLGPDGLQALNQGLKVSCAPTPSLPANPPATTAPTKTITVPGGSTDTPTTTTTGGGGGTTTTSTTTTTTSGGSTPTGFSTVHFTVNATTVWGENIYLTGNVPQLKSWSPDTALGPLPNPSYPIWEISVSVPAQTHIEYKYIRKFNGAVTWEGDPNRSFTSPADGQTTSTSDTWRY